MAVPWIQVYSNLPHHPKTSALADALKLGSSAVNPNAVAVGILIGIWSWAIQNAYDGDLSACSARAIAEAAQWKKDPAQLLEALIASRWIDEDLRLHDWEEYAVLLISAEENRRENDKKRAREYRERRKASRDGEVTGSAAPHVTFRENNAATVHNITKQKTEERKYYYPSEKENIFLSLAKEEEGG